VRIAFLVSTFPTVSETFILDQVTGLIDRGHDVEIFPVLSESKAAVHPEVEARGLPGRRYLPPMPEAFWGRPAAAIRLALSQRGKIGGVQAKSLNFLRYGARAASLRLFFETAAIAARPRFDVIHAHFGPNGVRGLALREIGAVQGPLITSFYGYDVSEFPKGRSNPYGRLFAEGERFLAISGDMKSKLIGLGCEPARILVHPLGVKTDLFTAAEGSRPGETLRITTIGRMVPKKGYEFGLRAVAELVREVPGIRYRIIGDGPLRPVIEKMVDELGLGGVVELAGWQSRPEVVRALHETDILLAPSITAESGDEEGTPVVIMEAFASGIPVVSSFHAGIPEVVRHGVSGFLAPEGDVAQLAAGLGQLAGSAEMRRRMGVAGRADIRRNHDIDKLNDQLIEIYSERGIPVGLGARPRDSVV